MKTPLVATLCLLGTASVASAEPPRVLVGSFRTDGDIPPAVLGRLATGLDAGLGATLPLVSADARAKALADAELAACSEGPCLARLGAAAGARVLVLPSVRSEFESYFLAIRGLDVSNGSLLLERQGACEICTVIEAQNSTTAAAETFARDLAPMLATLQPAAPASAPPVPVAVSSKPSGAEVRIDGRPMGETDLVVELAPAEYRLEVALAGHDPVTRRMIVEPGKTPPSIHLDLKQTLPLPAPPAPTAPPAAPTAPPVAQPSPPIATAPDAPSAHPVPPAVPLPEGEAPTFDLLGAHVPYATAAFLSLGAGLILLGTGGVLMGLDGEKTCTGPLERCPTLYATGTAGLVSVIGGGAGLLASVALFVLEQAERGVGIEEPPSKPTMPTPAASVDWAPWLDPAGGVGLELRW